MRGEMALRLWPTFQYDRLESEDVVSKPTLEPDA